MTLKQRFIGVFRKLHEHKKKSVFFSFCLCYAGFRINRIIQENAIFRDYCSEAASYGAQKVHKFLSHCKFVRFLTIHFLNFKTIPYGHNRRVLVIINRTSKNNKCRTKFEKYAEPLLHLAGLEVNIATTKDEDETFNVGTLLCAKDTDSVFIVGGDGTVSKVVNGMMKNEASLVFLLLIGVFKKEMSLVVGTVMFLDIQGKSLF